MSDRYADSTEQTVWILPTQRANVPSAERVYHTSTDCPYYRQAKRFHRYDSPDALLSVCPEVNQCTRCQQL